MFCFATGNTARMRKLNCGLIEVGRAADFVFLDRAQHTAGRDLLESVALGDIPGVGMVMIDGIVRCGAQPQHAAGDGGAGGGGMTMRKETAAEILQIMIDCGTRLDRSVQLVKDTSSDEEFKSGIDRLLLTSWPICCAS